jgi:hypothetical protein
VHQAAGVRGVQGAGHLSHDRHRAGQVQAALTPQQGGQVGAVHVPHGDVEQPAGLVGVVDRDDVGVLDAGGDGGLAQEAAAKPSSAARSGRSTLSATLRPRLSCSARYTSPMPPRPMRASMR